MAAPGVSKCGAPDEEHTWFTGMVSAVPGVLGSRHGNVVVVVDVELLVAPVAIGGEETLTVESGTRWVAL